MRKPGITAFALSAGAVVWSALLLVAAFEVDVYSGASQSMNGPVREFGSTLVEANGHGVLIPMSVPLVLCTVVFLALRRAFTTASERARTAALTIACVLCFLSILAGFSFGFLVMPAAAAALIATLVTPVGRAVH